MERGVKLRYFLSVCAFVLCFLVLMRFTGEGSATPSSFVPHAGEGVSRHALTDPNATATPTSTPGCPPAWRLVPSQDLGTNSVITGVVAIAANDVWAVGTGGV